MGQIDFPDKTCKKPNVIEKNQGRFIGRAVHKLVCTGWAADRGVVGVAGDGDLIAISPANAGTPVWANLGETSEIACSQHLHAVKAVELR